MSRNRQHQWEPVPGPDNLVKCKKCGTEVKASRARRGAGPCIWGEAASSPPALESEGVRFFLGDIEITREEAIELGGIRAGVTELYDQETTKPPIVINVQDGIEIKGIEEPPQHPGPRLTDPPEYCNVCGDQIAILPLNSRLDMAACNNRHCSLYRERLRMVTKPAKRGKRKRGNRN